MKHTAISIAHEVARERGIDYDGMHHVYGRQFKSLIGVLNDILGIGVLPLKTDVHMESHTKLGKRSPLDKLSAAQKADLFEMAHEQTRRIIARNVKD